MRGVEFAEHLGKHVAERPIGADAGELRFVLRAVEGPVHAVQILAVELFLRLTPDVIEQERPLGHGVDVERRREGDRLPLAALRVDLHETAIGEQMDELPILAQPHARRRGVQRDEHAGGVFAEVAHPEIESLFKTGEVVESVTLRSKRKVPQIRCMQRETNRARFDVVKFEDKRLGCFLGFVVTRFIILLFAVLAFVVVVGVPVVVVALAVLLLGIRVILLLFLLLPLLLLLLELLAKFILLAAQTEAVERVAGQECRDHVKLRAPAPVTAHAEAIGFPGEHAALHGPPRGGVVVSRHGNVGRPLL